MEEFTAARSGQADDLTVTMAGNMTIYFAAEMKETLLTAFTESSKLTCNIENVPEIDLAGLQLLCAAHKSSCAAGKTFGIVGLNSESIRKTMVAAGFDRHAGCMKDENSRCLWVGGAQ
jgi:anti-anti-sigma regulatory factor